MIATEIQAAGRSPEIPESADVYGWLIGSWELALTITERKEPFAVARERRTSNGRSKAAPCRTFGSYLAVRSAPES